MITLFINKFLSAFRVRQLYVAVDEVLDCHEKTVNGYTAIVTVFNRGKDKEKGIEVIFPETTHCQILAQSQPGSSHTENTIKIDRLAPGESISLSVFISGRTKLSKNKLPLVKSEDVTGRSFWGKANVWPSLGPVVVTASLALSITSLLFFIVWKAGSPDKVYYSVRYHKFLEQGFTPSFDSDNYLISQKSIFEKKYPVSVDSLYVKKGYIHFPIQITNTEKSPQRIEIRENGIDRDYYERANKLSSVSTAGDAEERSLRVKYSVPDNFWKSTSAELNPQETKTVIFTRQITPNLKKQHLSFEIKIKGKDASGELYSDVYTYNVSSSKNIPSELDISE